MVQLRLPAGAWLVLVLTAVFGLSKVWYETNIQPKHKQLKREMYHNVPRRVAVVDGHLERTGDYHYYNDYEEEDEAGDYYYDEDGIMDVYDEYGRRENLHEIPDGEYYFDGSEGFTNWLLFNAHDQYDRILFQGRKKRRVCYSFMKRSSWRCKKKQPPKPWFPKEPAPTKPKNEKPAPTDYPTTSPTTSPTKYPTKAPLPPPPEEDPKSWGDPHFRTWHGLQDFEFHGECDLVLIKAPFLNLEIHIRTTIRYDYSYISQAAVKIGNEVFEVASWGEYQLNDIQSVLLDESSNLAGYPIRFVDSKMKQLEHRKMKFYIELDPNDRTKDIVINTFKDYVSVAIEHEGHNWEAFHNSTGIMGDYVTGQMLARDGTTVMTTEDANAYGQEWQVRPGVDQQIFSGSRDPVYPVQCRLPSADAYSATGRNRRLGEAKVSQEQAEKACAHVTHDHDKCIMDVMKTGDVDIAEMEEES